jgi:epoxyqueuosine reductase
MKSYIQKLVDAIGKWSWKGEIVPIGHLDDLREAIRGRYRQGFFDEKFYQEQLSFFSFDLPTDLPDARSIIIVAVPTPQMRVTFNWGNQPVPVVIPPTYVSYTRRTEETRAALAGWLKEHGYTLSEADLPLKTLAVCSGLAEYGRGNICFVPGMGSFLQLVGAYSDLLPDGDPWGEPKLLDRCQNCRACERNCPTGAITPERFLIRAECCLTYHNEATGEFTDWIDPSWHHCLVGCMRCQSICPENKTVTNWFEDRAEFSEEETDLLYRQVPFDQLLPAMAAKLKSLEINEDYRGLCRNLAAILNRQTGVN